MIEITGEDIAQMRDDDLRTLVGRLCGQSKKLRLDPSNAILLCRQHDGLFDEGLISLTDGYFCWYQRDWT